MVVVEMDRPAVRARVTCEYSLLRVRTAGHNPKTGFYYNCITNRCAGAVVFGTYRYYRAKIMVAQPQV